MDKILWIVLTFLSGAVLPIQAGLNAKLGKAAASPLYASLISFLVGTVGLVLYILLTRQTVSWAGLKEAPVYLWLGGLLGAFYIAIIIFAFPKLGPGLSFGLIVAGQMIVSMLLEHHHVLVTQQNPINLMRVVGISLIIAGVVIIRKF